MNYLEARLVEFSSYREGEGRANPWLRFLRVLRKDNFLPVVVLQARGSFGVISLLPPHPGFAGVILWAKTLHIVVQLIFIRDVVAVLWVYCVNFKYVQIESWIVCACLLILFWESVLWLSYRRCGYAQCALCSIGRVREHSPLPHNSSICCFYKCHTCHHLQTTQHRVYLFLCFSSLFCAWLVVADT